MSGCCRKGWRVARMHAARKDLPRFVEPMLLGTRLPRDSWAIELKRDGPRGQLPVDATATWARRTRPSRDCTTEFPELGELVHALRDRRVVLDGELVRLGPDGRPEFAQVSRRLVGRSHRHAAVPRRSPPSMFCTSTATPSAPWPTRPGAILDDLLEDDPTWRVPKPLTGDRPRSSR
jgi:bifunctional non-homologous end joining protein LigD